MKKERLARLKLSLEEKQTELDNLCQKPDSVKKIEVIASGILRKNYKFVRQLEEMKNQDEQQKGVAHRRRYLIRLASRATRCSLKRQ